MQAEVFWGVSPGAVVVSAGAEGETIRGEWNERGEGKKEGKEEKARG